MTGARAQESTNPANTLVRFDILTAGTNFGSLDIELFDADKPETVRNFLLYVYTGGYSNLIAHRLEHNFVLQAGHALLDTNAAAGTNEFTSYKTGRNYGFITNEYSVGPVYSNVFGTLALARIGGLTNSGSMDWFINLNDNTGLDDMDGGFTVFGRVINTSAGNNGTNLLNLFRYHTNVVSKRITTPADTLGQLPVSEKHTPVRVQDLFSIRTTVIRSVAHDSVPPEFAITSPASNATSSAVSPVRFTGTASDNTGIARIVVDNGYGLQFLPATTNWTVDGQLEETNATTFRFWALDWFGNESSPIERSLAFTPPPHTNTIVRFNVRTGGTNFGSMDIELLDTYKPQTVRNFLLYVNAGVYSNVAVHQLDIGAKLRSGHVALANPDGATPFTDYATKPNFGEITNEFGAGPRVNNRFGTITLARFTGRPDSGSQDWYINLKDDPNGDVVDGGDTVFGRILNTTAPDSGTNLLAFFRDHTNTIFKVLFEPHIEILNALPLSTTRYSYSTNYTTNLATVTNGVEIITITNVLTRISTNKLDPQIRDLFSLSASIIGGPRRDTSRPKFTISSPGPRERVTTNGTFRFSGTAQDNQEVARVLYNAGSSIQIASGGADWFADIPLTPGTNIIYFWTIDYFGNQSRLRRSTLFHQVPAELLLDVSGAGKILGVSHRQILDINRNYTATAVPAKGNFFVRWEATNSANPGLTNHVFFPQISFPMTDGQLLRAIFATNPYPRLRGDYAGLLLPRTPNTNHPARVTGAISFTLNAKGVYSGKLQPLTATYLIRGKFDFGRHSGVNGARNDIPLSLNLTIATNGVERITGIYQDGADVADVVLYRVRSASDTAPLPAGPFTFAIPASTHSAFGEGFGVGTAVLGTNGLITMNGTLADGMAIAQTAPLLAQNHWAMLAKPYGNAGAFLATNTLSTGTTVAADARWLKPSPPTSILEPAGLFCAPFTPPAAGATLLGWTNGIATLSGGGLETPVNVNVSLDGGAILVGSNSVNLELTAVATNGTITGSFRHPVSNALTPLNAVVLQPEHRAAGFFPGTNRSGAFRLRAAD